MSHNDNHNNTIKEWEEYIAKQEAALADSNAQVQQMLDSYGMSLSQMEEIAGRDIGTIEPALLQQLQMETGVKLADLPLDKVERPAPTASRFRQRTRALSV